MSIAIASGQETGRAKNLVPVKNPELYDFEPITANEWQKIVEGYAYQSQEVKKKSNFEFDNQFLEFSSYLLWGLLFAFILSLIVWFLKFYSPKVSAKDMKFNITDELIQTDEKELNQQLKGSLNSENYQDAIRYRFGQILQSLRNAGYLNFSPGKTNQEYLEELEPQFKTSFETLSQVFGFALYAGKPVLKEHFEAFEIRAKELIGIIDNSSKANNR